MGFYERFLEGIPKGWWVGSVTFLLFLVLPLSRLYISRHFPREQAVLGRRSAAALVSRGRLFHMSTIVGGAKKNLEGDTRGCTAHMKISRRPPRRFCRIVTLRAEDPRSRIPKKYDENYRNTLYISVRKLKYNTWDKLARTRKLIGDRFRPYFGSWKKRLGTKWH